MRAGCDITLNVTILVRNGRRGGRGGGGVDVVGNSGGWLYKKI